MTLAGYGLGGDPRRGGYVPARADIKRLGENALDVFVPGADGYPRAFIYDFDGPDITTNVIGGSTLGNRREATVGAGDSGGPVLVLDNGRWVLVGIHTFNLVFPVKPPRFSVPPPRLGSGGGGMLIAPYAAWLRALTVTYPPR